MMKILGLTLIFCLLIGTFTAGAFPAPGRYGSLEKARASDTGELLDMPLWSLEVKQSDVNYGTVLWASKGVWIGKWTVPLSVSADAGGRYHFTAQDDSGYSTMKIALEETGANSFIMHIAFITSRSTHHYTAVMNRL